MYNVHTYILIIYFIYYLIFDKLCYLSFFMIHAANISQMTLGFSEHIV